MSAASEKIFKTAKKLVTTDDVLWESEIEGNKMTATAMLLLSGLVVLMWGMNEFGVFTLDHEVMTNACTRTLPLLIIPAIICFRLNGSKRWIKYLLMVELLIVLAVVDGIMTYTVEIIMLLPLLASIRYYDRKFVIETAVLTLILFGVFAYFAPDLGLINLNYIDAATSGVDTINTNGEVLSEAVRRYIDIDTYRRSYMQFRYLPKVILYMGAAFTAAQIADRGRNMVIQQKKITNENSRIETELSLATDIQANLLPSIFPPFPDRKEIDIFASMSPAKEVGGDFYDYFLIDEDHLALVIGDVSGKGVPAALFMVTAKTLIKDHASLGISSGKVFTSVNDMLCEGNDAGLFVTAFMAVINLKTGKVYTVNAGHNPPLIRRGEKIHDGLPGADATYEYIPVKPGFVLAGMEGMKYKTHAFNIYPGDSLFLYTDGVTEATNTANELYGEDRLQQRLNEKEYESMEDLCSAVKTSVNAFADTAPQFDDITMLAFKYLGPDGLAEKAPDTITVTTTTEHVQYVTEFVEGIMSKYNVPMKAATQINIAIDELYSNISKFAYMDLKTGEDRIGNATITVHPLKDDNDTVNGLKLEFIDNGNPYNPLLQEDPLTNLPADERDIGGLGILIVKKQMDTVDYRYEDDCNILTITKMF